MPTEDLPIDNGPADPAGEAGEIARAIAARHPAAQREESLDRRKADKVRGNLKIDGGDAAFVFFDATVLGKYRVGAAFTDSGLYWNTNIKRRFFSWEEFREAPLPAEGYLSGDIRIGGELLPCTGLRPTRGEMLDLLCEIRFAIGGGAPQSGPVSTRERFMLENEPRPGADEAFILHLAYRAGLFKPEHWLRAEPDGDPGGVPLQRRAFGIPERERVLAFRDQARAVRRSGDRGVVLTEAGVYIRGTNDLKEGLPSAFISYGRLGRLDKPAEAGDGVRLNGQLVYKGSESRGLARMLSDLRLYVSSLDEPGAEACTEFPYDSSYAEPWELFAAESGTRWIAAEDGMPRGVYTESELRAAAEAGLIDRNLTRFWAEGQPRWKSAEEAGFI
ncbi:DUF4339 domain-containing protein [Saccharibacillus sp. CPCC 101409]|uniref:DUF4339 domain-containing protein n=1 Tax=Saccharibacillus sp. CPCC 101409 TaxID=3058041 RepID=UPI002670D837|nr:DUF4339 domain-containing protein [Saccharibacillus sp. CPCC 101409]MDO3408905.1 DUF4339 domain-containing protein [Saccharibacillus sp. CPCC 101409]